MTIVRYDGDKVCKVVGPYIASKLSSNICKVDIGVFRDNRTVVLRNKNDKESDGWEKT